MLTSSKCLALALLAAPIATDALSGGAGGCAGGMAAVSGPHLAGSPTTGSLADGGVTMLIDGEELTGDTLVAMPGGNYTITLNATGSPFRGVLFRLGTVSAVQDLDLSLALEGDEDVLQPASVCAGDDVFGLTHMNPEFKTEVSVEFTLDMAAELTLDVTVVMSNNANEGSEYYYSGISIGNAYPPCNICGADGMMPSNPEANVTIPDSPQSEMMVVSCADFYAAGQMGAIAPNFCASASIISGPCECTDGDGGDAEPTAAPSTEPADSSANSFGLLASMAMVILAVVSL